VADFDPAAAVVAAAGGDQRAWNAIVERYSGLVWAVARGFRLGAADAADVSQATWLRLVEHLGDIRDGERLGAWLATTARREALGVLRRDKRSAPSDMLELLPTSPDALSSPEDQVLRTEQEAGLWRAFRRLPERCQQVLRVMLADPPPTYAEAAGALDMPIGSLGPTRARCLGTLRTFLAD